LAEVVTRLRRVLRSSIRGDFPWERLPMAQVEVLQRLAEEPGLRVSELATRHRLATNTVSNLVQQMVLAGLVARREDPRDRRAVTVELTSAGDEQLRSWLEANARRLESALGAVPPADRTAILAALPALSRLVDQMERADDQVGR
jgi:DNA-binding MarR family transcriptional regulator